LEAAASWKEIEGLTLTSKILSKGKKRLADAQKKAISPVLEQSQQQLKEG